MEQDEEKQDAGGVRRRGAGRMMWSRTGLSRDGEAVTTKYIYVRLFAVPGAGALSHCLGVGRRRHGQLATDTTLTLKPTHSVSHRPSRQTFIMARQQQFVLTAAMILCCCGGGLIVSALDLNKLYGHIHAKRNMGT